MGLEELVTNLSPGKQSITIHSEKDLVTITLESDLLVVYWSPRYGYNPRNSIAEKISYESEEHMVQWVLDMRKKYFNKGV